MAAQTCPPLGSLYVYLSEGCNLACRHCWLAPSKMGSDFSRAACLPVELLDHAIREAQPLGLASVKLSGGEPLIHPELAAVLELVRRAELGLVVETNGVLCTPAVAADIARSPGAFVSVSIDGADAATHDWVRGEPGAFAKAQQGVRNLVAAGCAPQLIMTLMRHNADQVEAVVAMAERLGAASVKLNVVQPVARGEQMRDKGEGLDVAEILAIAELAHSDLAPRTRLRLLLDIPLAFRPLGRLADGNGCSTCSIHSVLGVLASGHWALCGIGEWLPELVFGRIGDDPLVEVWQGNGILDMLRTGLPDRLEGVCRRCLMKDACLGSCVAVNYYRRGSPFTPFWFCEAAEREGLFPSTRLDVPGAGGRHTAQEVEGGQRQ